MDIDFLRSISEDPTEMMMMMHFEKLPDFSAGVYADDQGAGSSTTATITTNLHINANMSPCFMEEDSSNFLNPPSSTNISFSSPTATRSPVGGEMQFLSSSRWRNGVATDGEEAHSGRVDQQKRNSMAAMREMIFRIAAMQPIHIDPESVKPPKRRNVKISKDPQSVAARHRREKISERIRILQRLVPGGTKMDTASMLDEAIHYVKFLKNQVQTLEKAGDNRPAAGIGFPVPMSSGNYIPTAGTPAKDYQQSAQNVPHYLGA